MAQVTAVITSDPQLYKKEITNFLTDAINRSDANAARVLIKKLKDVGVDIDLDVDIEIVANHETYYGNFLAFAVTKRKALSPTIISMLLNNDDLINISDPPLLFHLATTYNCINSHYDNDYLAREAINKNCMECVTLLVKHGAEIKRLEPRLQNLFKNPEHPLCQAYQRGVKERERMIKSRPYKTKQTGALAAHLLPPQSVVARRGQQIEEAIKAQQAYEESVKKGESPEMQGLKKYRAINARGSCHNFSYIEKALASREDTTAAILQNIDSFLTQPTKKRKQAAAAAAQPPQQGRGGI